MKRALYRLLYAWIYVGWLAVIPYAIYLRTPA